MKPARHKKQKNKRRASTKLLSKQTDPKAIFSQPFASQRARHQIHSPKKPIFTPTDLLLPYQRAWVDDKSRFKIGLMARQIGKSFACAAEAVHECLVQPGSTWLILSAGQRQALEFIEKAKWWTQAFQEVGQFHPQIFESKGQALIKKAEIRWKNGSRILALPANPNTIRGYSANLILDEFAFYEQPQEIWRAIFPSISSKLKAQYKLRIISTPNGKIGKFYDLWHQALTPSFSNQEIREPLKNRDDDAVFRQQPNTTPEPSDHPPQQGSVNPNTENTHQSIFKSNSSSAYSRHFINIYDAVAQGLPTDLEELRANLDDPEGWAQEFECQFVDASTVLLPYELLESCENPQATENSDQHSASNTLPQFAGIDIGRKHDQTVIWILEKVGDVLWTRVVRLLQNEPFRAQLQTIAQLTHLAICICIDSTGIGAMLAEELQRWRGASRVESCHFSAPFKQELFTNLRRFFDDKLVRIPISRAIREDLHALQKVVTSQGFIRYFAPHRQDGHSDRATALALALRAAENASCSQASFTPLRSPSRFRRSTQTRRDRTLSV